MDNRLNPLNIYKEDKMQGSRNQILSMMRQSAQDEIDSLQQSRASSSGEVTQPSPTTNNGVANPTIQPTNSNQPKILNRKYDITQTYGNRSAIEKFSGGIHYGTDFATPVNTPVALPEGNWVIEKVLQNDEGYGNSVLAVNQDTGEKLRFSHLSKLNANPGQNLQGTSVVGYTGGEKGAYGSGNSTGAHVDIEYYKKGGGTANIMESPFANQLY